MANVEEIILAIDPGTYGGLCFHSTVNGNVSHTLYKMPMIGNRVDVITIKDWVEKQRPNIVILEKQQNRNGQGSQSVIMINYGRLTAIFDICKIDVVEITPHSWQKKLGIGSDKSSHIDFAVKAGYDVPTKNPKGKILSDGIADACCMCEAWIIVNG